MGGRERTREEDEKRREREEKGKESEKRDEMSTNIWDCNQMSECS